MQPTETVREAFILTTEVINRNNRSFVVIYASSDDEPIRMSMSASPYFFIESEPVETEAFRSLTGKHAVKVTFPNIYSAEEARKKFRSAGLTTFESDVRLRDRFLMDHRLHGSISVSGNFQKVGSLLTTENPTLSTSTFQPNFVVCSLDIETSVSEHSILSIGVHVTGKSREVRHVFMRGEPEASTSETTFLVDERALLGAFEFWFRECDPDIIIGWNVIGFDLAFLLERANCSNLPLRLGRESRNFSVSERTGRFSRATIPGRVVLDGPQLLRTSFHSFESYSLESVAQNVLGHGKLLASNEGKAFEIERLFRQDKAALAAYNLKDTVLVTEIFRKLELIELTTRRTQLSGMLLDQVGMSIASLDHYVMPRMHDLGFVAPDVEDISSTSPSTGGYVMAPKAGIFDGILGLDFQSLYPTIIRTFSIDPVSRAANSVDAVRTPTGHCFSQTVSVLPNFIAQMLSERAHAKKSNNRPLSQAIKILMNSFYGVMGTPGSRMYHRDLPDAITGTGQWLLTQSIDYLKAAGHEVLYGDTDSLFVKPNTLSSSPQEQGRELGRELTSYWRERLGKEFFVESHLVLDFKCFYKKFLIPSARAGVGGAKKRYAGMVVDDAGERTEFVGLEAVRSDWTPLARDFQIQLYERVFKNQEVRAFLKEFVFALKSGLFDEKLIYRKRLHKPIDEYGPSPPPYVRAARQLSKKSRTVRYIVTKNGPVPIELQPTLPDYEHYIAKQLKPIADAVLELLDERFDDLVFSQQLRLF